MPGSCTGGSVPCWMVAQADIINNIAASLGPVQKLITGAAYIIGLAFTVKAIYSLKVYGESRTMMSGNTNIKEPITYFIVSAIFLYFPTALASMLQTTFGDSNILQYTSIDSNNATISTLFGPTSPVGASLTMLIQTIGLIAFVRGWVMIARSASQGQPPGGTGKGLMHVFGGILAINIVATLQMINNTLYGS